MWPLNSSSRLERRPRRGRHPQVDAFEDRMLLSMSGLELSLATEPPAVPGQTAPLDVPTTPVSPLSASAAGPSGSTHPLSALPALNSLPGAKDSIYLNFLGDFVPSFGGWGNITIPAYDQDGDPSTFSDGELASIRTIWSAVAEDFAPFEINVTTVAPSNMAHGVTEKADIGGDGAWTGGKYGGMSFVGDFAQTFVPNIVFAFSTNLASNNVPGNPVYTADAISHELGHSFGLNHQSVYSGTALVQEYSTGPGDGTAPLMGSSYAAARSLWWYGQSDVSSTTYQDDMAVIASSTNGFGYRPEPADLTAATASALAVQGGNQFGTSGLIIHPSDTDYYSFTSGAGTVNFTVSVTAGVNNLAPKVELLSANGLTVIASAGPSSTDFSASLTANLPSSGTYLIMVTSSDGHYGNVGLYTISGTIGSPAGSGGGSATTTGGGTTLAPGLVALNPPATVTAAALSPYQISVTWANVPGATGYVIDRSDGTTWINVGTTGLGVNTFSDASVAPGTSYAYAVCALAAGQVSAFSALAWATASPLPVRPAAVSNVAVVSLAPRQVVLGWQPSSGAQGYQIERTTNGKTWTVVGRLAGNGATSFTDATVGPARVYFYRVRAFNAWGSAPASRAVRVTTPRLVAARALRKKPR